jgi:hypothetical protein
MAGKMGTVQNIGKSILANRAPSTLGHAVTDEEETHVAHFLGASWGNDSLQDKIVNIFLLE